MQRARQTNEGIMIKKEENAVENFMICNCKQVSYFDVEDALHKAEPTENLEELFREVQEITSCTTGCGGCHDKILNAISEIIHR